MIDNLRAAWTRLVERVRDKMITDMRTALSWWSVRLAALFGAVATYLLAAPDALVSAINSLPPELRTWAPPMLGPALTALIVAVRLYKQGGSK